MITRATASRRATPSARPSTATTGPLAPAFYAAQAGRSARSDWWALLHPPYTLWHLGYVAIGASLAPHFDAVRLLGTVLAFALAVGVAAHALDELQGRPLHTAISRRGLATAATLALLGAVALGVVGIGRVGVGLVPFIVVGATLTCAYNLELVGGRLHNGITFAAAWGAFPVLTAYYAQAERLGWPAIVAAAAAFSLSTAQRALSTPARAIRRGTAAVEGHVQLADGRRRDLDAPMLLRPMETALRAMAAAVTLLAAAMVIGRIQHG